MKSFVKPFGIGRRYYSRSTLFSMVAMPSEGKSPSKIPVTVLSGFLGAGKTSFLQHVLHSQTGKKFGLVVNDMATVNVDSKLIKQKSVDEYDGVETLELQNGCVCCSLAEDLILSVTKLVSMAESKKSTYDHIIVECSGIAEPRKIRDLFQEAEDMDYPLIRQLKLDTLITLVDARVFMDLFGSGDDINSNSELAFKPEDKEGRKMLDDGSGMRKVTELLLEQVECSDIVLINKCDLLWSAKEIELVKKVVASVNPTAKVMTCVRGEIPDPLAAIGSAKGEGAASWGILYEHKKLVETAEKEAKASEQSVTQCAPDCKDPTHNHDHSHEHSHAHSHEHATSCTPDCKDPTHDHSHSHEHATSCAPDCKDPTHDHSHSHSHSDSSSCGPACTDPTHDHDHSHSHSHSHTTTAEERFGITSFVYRRRTPFHPGRFSLFLQGLGKLSVKGISEMASTSSAGAGAGADKASDSEALTAAKKCLLRSKGFVWMGTSKAAAYFMSHAGQYLELTVLGRWWADIAANDWPKGSEAEITADFDGPHGDRRQELVFIGQFGNDGGKSRKALEEVLDSCLLTPEEMAGYEKVAPQGDNALRAHFFPEN